MSNKALVVIDIQNDITKHYKDIINNINSAIDWAMKQGMAIIYIKHNNINLHNERYMFNLEAFMVNTYCYTSFYRS